MENPTYATLTRQSGLMSEMRVIANNIANAQTTGYRQEGVTFSEYVTRMERGTPSLSMARAGAHVTSLEQGGHVETGGTFDLAIEGEGFFTIEAPEGQRLTRAGAFTRSANGDLVTPDGYPLLGAGGAAVFAPPDAADISISSDGTVSADGTPIGLIELVIPAEPTDLVRADGTSFTVRNGTVSAENGRIAQGFVEASNVDPILQIARMIEVQRAYELGASFLDKEDERIRNTLQTLTK